MRAAKLDIHRTIDWVFAGSLRPGSLYTHGFGPFKRLDALVEHARRYPQNTRAHAIDIKWQGGRRWAGLELRRGSFHSPAAELLPASCRRAHIELVLDPSARRPQPVCVLLAATGESGFARRRSWARSLARHGIGSLMLENPFYGLRRPRTQHGTALRTVCDQFCMNLATLDESRALLRWLREQGHRRVGVSGYSQGGVLSAFAGATFDAPIAVIPRAAGSSAGSIFTSGAFSRALDWKHLARERGSLPAARRYLSTCLEPVDARRLPAPRCPSAAIIVAAKHDAFVSASESHSLHRHWRGSQLRWLEGGHLSSALLRRRAQLRAIVDAFAQLAVQLGAPRTGAHAYTRVDGRHPHVRPVEQRVRLG